MKAARVLFPLFLIFSAAGEAGTVTVQNLRLWRAPDNTRLVFDLSGPLEHRLFQLQDPRRIVIDLDNARLQGALPGLDPGDPILAAIRAGTPESGTLRFVLDLKVATKPRTFVLGPAGQYGHRLVIDLYNARLAEEEDARAPPVPEEPAPAARRELVIAIDAGHGGEDPGAIGPGGLREKDAALDLAKRLAELVRRNGGQAVLTREDDTFIPLRRRTEIANTYNKHKGVDAFISIHLNAAPTRKARGIETYTLSLTNDKRSLEVAARENGMRLDRMNETDLLLTHLAVDAKKDPSLRLAHRIQSSMAASVASKYGTADLGVKQGPFWVLYGADMPSILAEVSFVSHPKEERLLKTDKYRDEIAQAIYAGLEKFRTKDVTATLRAAREP